MHQLGPVGPLAPGDAPDMPAFAGMDPGGYGDAIPYADPPPGPGAALPPPQGVMMSPQAARREVVDRPLVDTSRSVSFAPMPAEPPPYAPAMAPYGPPAPFPVRRRPAPAPMRPGLGEPPERTSALLGLALLVVGVGVGVGAKYGGLFGGVAGGLYGGASINAIRAVKSITDGTPTSDREAAISGTYALLGAAAATYMLYQTRKKSEKV